MELEKEEAKTTTMRCFITSKGLKKSEVYRFFFAACMLSVTTVAVGLYLSAASQDLLTPRQLLREEPPNLRTVTKSEITIDSDNPVVKLELVSFRSLQPDGSLEIKHIYVETKVHVVDRSPPTAVAAMKTRQSLRPSRRLVEVSESNDEHDNEELAADKKVRHTSSLGFTGGPMLRNFALFPVQTHPTPFQTSGSFFFVGTEEVDESINDDETPVFYRKVSTVYAMSDLYAKLF